MTGCTVLHTRFAVGKAKRTNETNKRYCEKKEPPGTQLFKKTNETYCEKKEPPGTEVGATLTWWRIMMTPESTHEDTHIHTYTHTATCLLLARGGES